MVGAPISTKRASVLRARQIETIWTAERSEVARRARRRMRSVNCARRARSVARSQSSPGRHVLKNFRTARSSKFERVADVPLELATKVCLHRERTLDFQYLQLYRRQKTANSGPSALLQRVLCNSTPVPVSRDF